MNQSVRLIEYKILGSLSGRKKKIIIPGFFRLFNALQREMITGIGCSNTLRIQIIISPITEFSNEFTRLQLSTIRNYCLGRIKLRYYSNDFDLSSS